MNNVQRRDRCAQSQAKRWKCSSSKDVCDHITRECEEGAEMEETDHKAKIVEDVNENDTKLTKSKGNCWKDNKEENIFFYIHREENGIIKFMRNSKIIRKGG